MLSVISSIWTLIGPSSWLLTHLALSALVVGVTLHWLAGRYDYFDIVAFVREGLCH